MEGKTNPEIKSSVSNVRKSRPTPKYSRWNPTAEQKRMLEKLYEEGLRWPTADHVAEVTAKLKCLGKVEEKNVFYWFQNRKARHMRMRREEKAAALTKQLVHMSHDANVNTDGTHGTPCAAQTVMATPTQNSKVYPDCGIKKNPVKETVAANNIKTEYLQEQKTTNMVNMSITPETLILFPLHPTLMGMSQRVKMEQELNNTPTSAPMDHPRNSCDEVGADSDGGYAQPNFFELFTGKSYQMFG